MAEYIFSKNFIQGMFNSVSLPTSITYSNSKWEFCTIEEQECWNQFLSVGCQKATGFQSQMGDNLSCNNK